MRNGLILFLILNINYNLYSSDSINTKIDKNFYKFLAAEGIVLTGAITYLKYQWYDDKNRVPFHSYNDFKGWNQIDKLGHFYISYLESNVGYSLLKKFNFSEKRALYYGGFQGLLLETPIEFFDELVSKLINPKKSLLFNSRILLLLLLISLHCPLLIIRNFVISSFFE